MCPPGERALKPQRRTLIGNPAIQFLLVLLFAPGCLWAQTLRLQDSWRAEHMVHTAVRAQGRVYVGTQSGVVQVFKHGQSDGEELIRFQAEEEDGFPPAIRSLCFNSDESLCLMAVADDRLMLLRVTGSQADIVWVQPGISAMKVLFRDAQSLAVGDMSGELCFLSASDGHELYREQKEYAPVSDMAFSPSGQQLAISFASSKLLIVDAQTGENQQWLSGHKDQVFCLAWQTEHMLLSGAKDKRLLSYNLQSANPEGREVLHNDRYVTALAVRPDGFGAWCRDGTGIGVFRLGRGEMDLNLDKHSAPIQVLEFLDGGKTLLSSGNDARICLWQVEE